MEEKQPTRGAAKAAISGVTRGRGGSGGRQK